MANEYKYDRVLLKLSGEALAGDQGYGIDPRVVDDLAEEIAEIVHDGVQLAVVVGGGNICLKNKSMNFQRSLKQDVPMRCC